MFFDARYQDARALVCHSKEPAWESECVIPRQWGEPPAVAEAAKWGQELLTGATLLAFPWTNHLGQLSFQPSLTPPHPRGLACLNITPHHVSMSPPGMEHTCSHWAPTAARLEPSIRVAHFWPLRGAAATQYAPPYARTFLQFSHLFLGNVKNLMIFSGVIKPTAAVINRGHS